MERGQPGAGAGESCRALSQVARECGVYLVGGLPLSLLFTLYCCILTAGSIPEKREGKYYNTSMTFGPDGALLGVFRKVLCVANTIILY